MDTNEALTAVWDTLHNLRDGDRYDWDTVTVAMDVLAQVAGYNGGTLEWLEEE